MIDPCVSIIIPIYNAEKHLHQCIDSLIKQTYREFEIICVDDGSTDHSLSILKEFASKDPRIVILSQTKSSAGCARNLGMNIAKGRYLLFLDGDDYFKQDMLESLVNNVNITSPDIVVFDAFRYDEKTGAITDAGTINYGMISTNRIYESKNLGDYIFNFTTPHIWNKLFRKDFIDSNQIKFMDIARTNDLYFAFIALALATKISIIDEKYVYYRSNNPKSLQGTNDYSPTDFYYAHMEVKKRLINSNKYQMFERSFVNHLLESCFYNLSSLKTEKAFVEVYSLIRGFVGDEILPRERYYIHRQELYMQAINLYNNTPIQYLLNCNNTWVHNFELYQGKLSGFRNEKRLAVYAAGKIGKECVRYITQNSQFELAGWYDKNYERLQKEGYLVQSPLELMEADFDILLIAVEEEVLAKAIYDELLLLGLPKEKLEWIYSI